MELIVEWTFEGSLKSLESMVCREPDPLSMWSVCQYMEEDSQTVEVEWYRVNMNLLPPQSGQGWGAFYYRGRHESRTSY